MNADNEARAARIAQLRADALAIWQAGVAAVGAEHLVREAVQVDDQWLLIGDEQLQLTDVDRICVLGAGKAGAGMAAGLIAALGETVCRRHRLTGWVNVPADCVRPLEFVHLHAARPAGVNEPTDAGVTGTEEILRLAAQLGPKDLCITLLSGGASALLAAPVAGITLADKQQVTRFLSAAGADIVQLNTVRKQLSRVKGGRLAAACRAGQLITLVISDVLGDPLDVIGSGPTVPDSATPLDALRVLEQFDPAHEHVPASVWDTLRKATQQQATRTTTGPARQSQFIIGNNARAVDAAGTEAVARDYAYVMMPASTQRETAEAAGRRLVELAVKMQAHGQGNCLLSGGEPVVQLAASEVRGRGGRNQQLALAALVRLDELTQHHAAPPEFVLLSGGTDGEDGPTDAAGAVISQETLQVAARLGLNPRDYLARNDAYSFFAATGGLIKTGPTHTNVCDLRVVLID